MITVEGVQRARKKWREVQPWPDDVYTSPLFVSVRVRTSTGFTFIRYMPYRDVPVEYRKDIR